jgi:hypothetical protein
MGWPFFLRNLLTVALFFFVFDGCGQHRRTVFPPGRQYFQASALDLGLGNLVLQA